MELLSRKEVAKILGVSKNTLDKWRAEGKIGYFQPHRGGKVFFTQSQVEAFLAQAEHKPRAARRNSHQDG